MALTIFSIFQSPARLRQTPRPGPKPGGVHRLPASRPLPLLQLQRLHDEQDDGRLPVVRNIRGSRGQRGPEACHHQDQQPQDSAS